MLLSLQDLITVIISYMVVHLLKFKICNLYKMQPLDLLPTVRNMVKLPRFLRNCTGFLLKKELCLKI